MSHFTKLVRFGLSTEPPNPGMEIDEEEVKLKRNWLPKNKKYNIAFDLVKILHQFEKVRDLVCLLNWYFFKESWWLQHCPNSVFLIIFIIDRFHVQFNFTSQTQQAALGYIRSCPQIYYKCVMNSTFNIWPRVVLVSSSTCASEVPSQYEPLLGGDFVICPNLITTL